jgi:hypothetical protein
MAEQQFEPKVVGFADFTVESLGVTKILLEDGTRIKVQVVPVRISKTDKTADDGQPLYLFQFHQTIDQTPPDGKIMPDALKRQV